MGDANMFGEGTMAVDVVVLRELEHRRKVARMKQIPEAEFCRNLRPLVVQSSIPGPGLCSNPRTSSNPCPRPPATPNSSLGLRPTQSPNMAPRVPLMQQQQQTPNKESPNIAPRVPSRQQQQQQQPTPYKQHELAQPCSGSGLEELRQNHNDNIFCKICQAPCGGYANYMQHLKGRRHKSRKQELELGRIKCGDVESPRRWCEACKIWCMNDDIYQSHLRGKQHKNQLQMPKAATDTEPEDNGMQIVVAAMQGFRCEVCGIDCSGEESLTMHFKGKKHNAVLRNLSSARGGGTQGGSTGNQPRYRCDLCNIGCSDRRALEMHRQGKRHIVQLHAHESRSKKARP